MRVLAKSTRHVEPAGTLVPIEYSQAQRLRPFTAREAFRFSHQHARHAAAAVLRTARVDSFVDQKLRQTGMIDDLTKSPKTSTHLGRGRRRDSFGREVRSRMNESPVRESSCLEGPSLVATLALALG